MITIQNDGHYDKDVYIINPSNITYIRTLVQDTDGYIYKKTYILNIHFIGQPTLELKTYDKEKFNKWLELFEIKEKIN